jgi:hypothetical protein
MIRWLFIVCVALLAGAATSPADIIHTATNFFLGEVWQGAEYKDLDLDLDENGTVDFSIVTSVNNFCGIAPDDQNKYLIHPSPPPNIGGSVAALDVGYLIGSNSGDNSPEEWFGIDNNYGTLISIWNVGSTGEFLRHRGFVGLEFESTDGTHYGWLDIEGVANGGSYLIVHGWAYETTPNISIIAGAIPEPSSMILFVIGVAGIWTIRKKKNC